ncbi:MAG: hypothetical protein ACPKPY_09870 [Nitrososphaeraceae archaeon]
MNNKLDKNDDVLNIIQFYEYKPSSISYPPPNDFNSYPLNVRAFISMLTGKWEGFPSYGDLYNKRIFDDKELLNDYFGFMNIAERNKFLAFYTIEIHELTHHIDFMSTPFGVNYYYKLLNEYIAFQRFVPELLKSNSISNENAIKLLDFDNLIENKISSFELIKYWNKIKEQIRFFDAYFHQGKEKMQPVTQFENDHSIDLFTEQFDRVLVNDFMFTIRIPTKDDYYLRPVTILESRGLIHSLRWILYQLGYTTSSITEMTNYFNEYYSSDRLFPDYRFLIDIFFKLANIKNITELKNFDARGIDNFLSIMSSVCWYALQSPPPTNETTLLDSSPVAKLLLAMRSLEDNGFTDFSHSLLSGDKNFSNSVIDYNLIDKNYNDGYGKLNNIPLLPINKILDISIKIVNKLKFINNEFLLNLEIKNHFNKIFEIQNYQLEKRINSGYDSSLGNPSFGNPMFGIRDNITADQLLPNNYEPSKSVLTWFQLRENLIFKKIFTGRTIISKFKKIFDLDDNNISVNNNELSVYEDIYMTIPISYNIESIIDTRNNKIITFIVIDDRYLPRINDLQNVIVQHRIYDYLIGSHVVIHIELYIEKTGRFKKFNIIICPMKMTKDNTYKTNVEFLIKQTFDPITNQYPIKDAEICLVNSNGLDIFLDKMDRSEKKLDMMKSNIFYAKINSSLKELARWHHLLSQSELQTSDTDSFYKNNLCQFCKTGK